MKLGWVQRTLGDTCEIYQPKTITAKEMVANGPYPVFGANGIIGRHDKFNHEEPQLLITCRGATCGTVNVSEPFSWITGNAMVVRPKDNSIDLRFLEYAFRGEIDIGKAITGAAQPQITRANLAPLKISYPSSLIEQHRIVDLLSRAEGIVRLRREAEKKTAELIPALFLDMFGDPVTNPKEWHKHELREIGRVITGNTPPTALEGMFGGEIPFITPGDLEINTVLTKRFLTDDGAAKARIVRAGATLVCCIGATIGKTDRAWKTSAFNQQINAVDWDASLVADDYGLVCMRFYSHEIESQGSTTALPILKKSLFEKIQIPLPPIELQQRFQSTMGTIRSIQAQQSAATAKAQSTFDALLHTAFSS